ncbi:MAG: lytic murein transglycosylase [Melioribacteraceae bacterium]|nr:lytic murein transglycosylase [Melioribacteraceae bacterium]
MKTCPKCNKEFSDEKKFCGDCGVQLSESIENKPPVKPKVRVVVKPKLKKPLEDGPSSDSYEIPLPTEEMGSVTSPPPEFSRSPQRKQNSGFNPLFLIPVIMIILIVGGYFIFFNSDEIESAPPVVQNNTTNETPLEETATNEEEIFNEYQINYKELVSNSNSWELSTKYILDEEGNPRNDYIANFLDQLGTQEGTGTPVSRNEFLELLNDSRAKIVYADKLIKYATPLNEMIQKKEHEDFTKVFLQEKRVLAGIKFLHDYKNVLSEVESKYKIPRKDIVSILMWESGLGEFTGNFQIFNVFLGQITLMDYAQEYSIRQLKNSGQDNPLDDPSKMEKQKRRLDFRRKDAAKSLASLLRICKSTGQDPLKQIGSWGGAIGFVQFMPYNLVYAVDGDRNGEINLFDFNDAIYSAANYLVEVGHYGDTEGSRHRAIFAYNRSNEYVDGVKAYAEAIWTRYSAGE